MAIMSITFLFRYPPYAIIVHNFTTGYYTTICNCSNDFNKKFFGCIQRATFRFRNIVFSLSVDIMVVIVFICL